MVEPGATLAGGQSSSGQRLAQPLHIQRLEASLDMGPFMSYAQTLLLRPLTSSEDSDSDLNVDMLSPDDKLMNGVVVTKRGTFKLIWLSDYKRLCYLFYLQIDEQINSICTISRRSEAIVSGCKTFC